MGQSSGVSEKVKPPLRGDGQIWFLAAVYVMAVIWGVRSVYAGQPSAVDLLLRPGMMIALAWWAIADSIGHRRPIPVMSRGWFLLAAGLAVPGYVVWSRGWRGVGLLLLHFIAWYLVCATAMIVGRIVVFVVS